ncbi:hypothetical protein BKA63DRAFT_562889 [Paraphoma chrysanthemicola]|nr:hypothetical protein BKA63DRAFT_562889 [Paraphoma chrysanthemicola]
MASDLSNPPKLSSFSAHVHITVAPADVPAFLEALKPVYEAVIAEPENVFFQVYQHPQQPGAFRFVENWDMSVEDFIKIQINKEYYKPYVAITEPMWIKPRTIEIWERMPGNEWISIKPQV